ncbi:type VII secretion protein [Bifidobacterium sp. CP2]|uniref:EsaB/YukD family protein n=1 Tax=Bifidobacterium sp. CP2 TaxID=2809025 RepID=UPI001BDD69E8|nr:EsaB/YukD family protein [Bifidobacterium sp. CP2]MBT1181089.1 type VII secretion protein [Bifidobacterium sp. CP2]
MAARTPIPPRRPNHAHRTPPDVPAIPPAPSVAPPPASAGVPAPIPVPTAPPVAPVPARVATVPPRPAAVQAPAPAPTVTPAATPHARRTPAADIPQIAYPVDDAPLPPETDADDDPRLTVTIGYKSRTITLNVGATPIVADLLPDIARRLGVLDPAIVYGGYRLVASGGEALDPSRTLEEQHVADGATLTLEPDALTDGDIVYDDVVEAVGASVQRVYKPWTNEHTTITSLIISAGLLLIAAACLALFPAGLVNATLGFAFCAVLMALAALLNGKAMTAQALVMGLVASLFAAIGGYQLASTLLPGQPFHGLPLLAAATGLIIGGGVMTLAASGARPYSLIPICAGLLAVIPSGLAFMFPVNAAQIWIFTTTLIALAANALPWMCLSMARISVDSPHSESEIFKLPEDIDYEDIRRRYILGSTMLFIGRVAVAALLITAAPLLAAQPNPLGALICLVAFLGMLLDSRQIYTLREMLVTVGAAGIGLVATAFIAIRTHPTLAMPLTLALLIGAMATVTITHVTTRSSLFGTRVADAAEVLCIILLPPLAYLTLTM